MSQRVCYTPDGSSRNAQFNVTEGWVYAPCDNTAVFSMCCAIGPGRDGGQDVCLENGLCRNDIDPLPLIWRESCTDPTWEDPACIKLFLNGTGFNETSDSSADEFGSTVTDVQVTQCDNGSWCYGEQNRGCCRNGEGVYVLNGQQVTFDPNATTSTTSTTSLLSTPTTSLVSSSSPASSTDSGLSTGAKAGIGVGAVVGGLLVLILLIWFVWRRRKHQPKPRQRFELPSESTPAMLDYSAPRSELPSSPEPSKGEGSTQYTGSSDGFLSQTPQKKPVEMYA